ncbi:FMRFamide-activated amiloride-sensitive sodium channel isoform X1 [Brachionus plicatilis]|uniref:FMRFamide-activated amiloride-sensitive sodium channel isoform X1 n=1 Tax=Brachionus plicatilis TaxID=10195 RepID=A0A3M7QE51_BRAPC|nr:FMRFamide-activated amiloride-sensitive sodium channel isoform X1 [Brachionus plicatilis]
MDKHKVATPSKKVIPTLIDLPIEKKNEIIYCTRREKKQFNLIQEPLKKCILEWCENTSSHGFSNMVRTDSWIIRIVWLILVLLFIGYCIFSVVTIILAYFKYEVVVSYKIVSDSPSPFPAITICNLNPFDFGTDEYTGTYLENVLINNSINPSVKLSTNDTAILKVDEIRSIIKAHATADKNLTSDDLKKKGFTIDTMLISCFYNNEECSLEKFHWFRDNDFGNCYTFNDLFDDNNQRIDSLKTSKSGPENGLKMEIFVGVSGIQDVFSIKTGIKVVIHERGVRPILKYDGIEVSTGVAANIVVSRTNFSKQPLPFSSCRKDPENLLSTDSKYHKYTLSISRYYQKLCYEICLQYEQIVPNCQCADPSIPIVDSNLTICSNAKSLNCVKEQRDSFDSSKNIDEVCGRFCPDSCDQMIYSTSISQSSYPTDYYSSILVNQNSLVDKFNPANEFTPLTEQVTVKKKRTYINEPYPILSPTTTSLQSNNRLMTIFFNQSNGVQSSESTTKPPLSKEKPGKSDVQMSVLMISTFYNDLQYTLIEESPAMTLEALFGLIGGQLGLFMGASFLSFMEILEMVINIARAYINNKNSK